VLTSGLAKSNPFLLTVMADALAQRVHVPEIENPTCVGAAIHGAVAAGVVVDFREGGEKFGAHHFDVYQPDPKREAVYQKLYRRYAELSADETVQKSVRANSSVRPKRER
jgi:L-ribulokinase